MKRLDLSCLPLYLEMVCAGVFHVQYRTEKIKMMFVARN